MSAKSCNQHEPLHQIYGYNDCCLCRVEKQIIDLQSKYDQVLMDLVDSEKERDALKKQLDVAVEALKKLEWIRDEFTGVTGGMCHICGGYRTKSGLHPGEFAGHKDTCIFTALKKLEA